MLNLFQWKATIWNTIHSFLVHAMGNMSVLVSQTDCHFALISHLSFVYYSGVLFDLLQIRHATTTVDIFPQWKFCMSSASIKQFRSA